MDWNTIYHELMKRDGYCRLCDKKLRRNVDKAIKFRTIRGNGDNIIICLDCIDKINKKIKQDNLQK